MSKLVLPNQASNYDNFSQLREVLFMIVQGETAFGSTKILMLVLGSRII